MARGATCRQSAKAKALSVVVALRRERRRGADEGFLTGEVGVELALASAITGEEPTWDRTLLLSHA